MGLVHTSLAGVESSAKMSGVMHCPPSGAERINSFALVCYLPGPLGDFLDRLRTELIPACVARSHVTILPPRQLTATEQSAELQIGKCIPGVRPFRIELADVEVFPMTKVIYLSLQSGGDRLHTLHNTLNVNALGFDEPYVYHPHVTLAQGLAPEHVDAATVLAAARWREFGHSRSFQIETLTFVQNTAENQWVDLVEYELGTVAAVHR